MIQSSTFSALTGPSALSTFRAARLLASIRAIEKSADSLCARFVHFIHASRPLDQTESARLEALLTYGEAAATADTKAVSFMVVPRLGTISPWSSKATDIARNTGLAAVQRIERGTLYRVKFVRRTALDAAMVAPIASVLHDRMTESVIDAVTDPALLFRELDSKPMQTVPMLPRTRGIGARKC